MGAMCRRSSTCALGLVFAEVVVFEEEGRAGAGWGCGGVAPEGVVVTGAAITISISAQDHRWRESAVTLTLRFVARHRIRRLCRRCRGFGYTGDRRGGGQ